MDSEVESLSYRHDSIKQEAAAEVMVNEDVLNSTRSLEKMNASNEEPRFEVEHIVVKEEPVSKHQELQASSSAACSTPTMKSEDDVHAEAPSGLAAAAGELREGSSDACDTSPVRWRSAAASYAGSLPSEVPVSSRGVEIFPPDILMSQHFLSALGDYSILHKDKPRLQLPDEHKFGLRIKCTFCDFYSHYSSELQQHMDVEHCQGKMLKLDSLFRQRCSEFEFIKQYNGGTHGAGKLFECQLCNYSSSHKGDLNKHLAGKHGLNKRFQCELCSFSTSYSSSLKFHLASKHSIGKKLLKCEVCDYSTAAIIDFKRHQASKHNLGKLLKCGMCDYSTAVNNDLRCHQARKHSLGKLFKCEMCDYATAVNNDLKCHQARKHSLGKLLKCDTCDYTTADHSNLKRHQASRHSLGKMLKCELCDYSTAVHRNLRRHQASKHTL